MLHKAMERTHTERQKRIYDFLDANRAGVLTSVSPDGNPHGAVIYHTINADFVVSFLTKTRTKKYDNIVHFNRVMYVVFEAKTQTVAQITGEAEEITDGYEVNLVAASVFMASLNTSEAGIPPVTKLNAGDYTAFRIKPKQIRMASYARPDSGEYDKIFESIESFELHE